MKWIDDENESEEHNSKTMVPDENSFILLESNYIRLPTTSRQNKYRSYTLVFRIFSAQWYFIAAFLKENIRLCY